MTEACMEAIKKFTWGGERKICVYGIAYPTRFHIHGTNLKCRYNGCMTATETEGVRAIAVIFDEKVLAWKCLDECDFVELTGKVDGDGYFYGQFRTQLVYANEHPHDTVSVVVPREMREGLIDGWCEFQLGALNCFEDMFGQACLSADDIVNYIISKLPYAMTNGISKQQRYELAMDTVKQFM